MYTHTHTHTHTHISAKTASRNGRNNLAPHSQYITYFELYFFRGWLEIKGRYFHNINCTSK